MAAVTVTNRSTRVANLDTNAAATNIGGGPGTVTETDFVFQGAGSVSRKVGTTLGGFYITTSSTNMTTVATAMWMAKVIATNKDALLGIGSPAMQVRVGSSATDYYEIDVHGFETYPLKGGWVIFPILVGGNLTTSNVVGSPNLAAVTYFAIVADFATASKGENLAMDAIDVGEGLCLVGGDGASADGSFADFLADDQGEQTNGRFGFFTELDGILSVFGRHYIGQNASGTASATEFTAQDDILVFPKGLFGPLHCGLFYDLTNAGTAIALNNVTMIAKGVFGGEYFDTELDVDGTNEKITNQDVIDRFNAGDLVRVYNLSGTESIGTIVPNTTDYFVGKDLTATPTGITLHADRNDALLESSSPGSGSPAGMTASTAGNGEIWLVSTTTVGVPSIFVTGSSGSAEHNGCTFVNMFAYTSAALNSAVAFNDCIFRECRSAGGQNAALNGCTIVGQRGLTDGDATCKTNAPANIQNNDFDGTGTRGHAVRIDATGTFDFTGNTFTGYGPADQSFDTETDVNGTTEVITIVGHGFSDGHPVVYQKQGGTEAIGLTNSQLYYLHFITADTFSLHLNQGDALNDNNRVDLTASGVGNGETHHLYSGRAAVHNNSGGLVTLNIVGGGNLPTIRNSEGSSTVVNLSVPVTITCIDQETKSPIEGVAVFLETDPGGVDIISYALTNASGQVVTSYSGSTPQAVTGFARKGTASPVYKAANITGTIQTSSGLSQTVVMVRDQ